jgi:hypothetical protein
MPWVKRDELIYDDVTVVKDFWGRQPKFGSADGRSNSRAA